MTKENEIYKYGLPDGTTNYTAEAFALLKAPALINKQTRGRKFIIYLHSLSVLQKMKNPYTKNYIFQQIKENLHIAKVNGIETTITWIPSHVGIKGNQIVDKAAKEAIEEENITVVDIPPEDMKTNIEQKIQEQYKEHDQPMAG